MALRARGTKFQLLGKIETTAGTKASGNYATLPCYSFDMSGSEPLTDDPVLSLALGRAPLGTFQDQLSIKGSARVPLDTGNFDFWMALMFGTVVSTGAGPHTDTYTAGGSVGSATFEKGFTDTGDFFEFDGVYADQMQLDFSPHGTAALTMSLMGMAAAARASSTIGGTPTVATYAPVMNKAITFKLDGSALANVTAGSLVIANQLDEIRTVRGATGGGPLGFDLGPLKVDGNLTLRYDGPTLDGYGIADSVHTVDISIALTGGFTIDFTATNMAFERVSAPVSGPGGIEQKVAFKPGPVGTATAFTVVRTRV